MALNASTLSSLIKADILANVPSANEDTVAVQKLSDAIADSVVAHIQAAAVVTTDVPGAGLVAPSGGGPVTGNATGTGSIA